MKTLRFISAEALVSDSQVAQKSLGCIAHNLYPLLFKASYLQEQGEMVHDIVQAWPLAELNIGKLLGKTADCEEDLSNRACAICLQAYITGLKDYVLSSSATYAKRLKVVDLTGIKDVEIQPCKCKKTLGRWARTELLSRTCFDLLIEMQRSEVDPSVFSTSIDVLINLFVTDRSYDLAVQTLLMRCHCPLKIRCVAFRADSLALRKLFYIIKLVQPESLQKLEVVHNIHLKMEHLEILLHNVSFPELRSLALPIRTFDVTRLTTESEPVLAHIGEMLSRMTQLREISLPFSILTGRIRRLLRYGNVN
nr:PREDICTED: leucine-rich repeat-containing protein 14B [Latimeria chalumnae]|eukprot:XP_006006618.1 PREDICTED: leucine-rich repeat-containing protein 14B [Latimeria chalumnae]